MSYLGWILLLFPEMCLLSFVIELASLVKEQPHELTDYPLPLTLPSPASGLHINHDPSPSLVLVTPAKTKPSNPPHDIASNSLKERNPLRASRESTRRTDSFDGCFPGKQPRNLKVARSMQNVKKSPIFPFSFLFFPRPLFPNLISPGVSSHNIKVIHFHSPRGNQEN